MTDLTPQARAIIDAARAADRPPPGAKRRIQAAILAGLATGGAEASAAAGAATSAKIGGAGLGLKLLAPLAIAALGLGGAWVAGVFEDSPQPAPDLASLQKGSGSEPEVVAVIEPIAEPVVEPVVEPIVEPEPEPEPEPKRVVRRRRAAKPEIEATPAPTSIREELALLRAVQSAVSGGNGERALSLIADHAEKFPRGQLVQEREAARVRALCSLDRADAARAAAAKFLKRWPKSSHAARVRSSCANTGQTD